MPASSLCAISATSTTQTAIPRCSLLNAPRYHLFNFNNKTVEETPKNTESEPKITEEETKTAQKDAEKPQETQENGQKGEESKQKSEDSQDKTAVKDDAWKAEKAKFEKEIEELGKKITETENALAAEKKKSDKYYTALSRAVADEENTRKIMKREMENMKNFAVSKFAKDLLEVTDNLTRGLQSVTEDKKKDNDDLEQLYLGVDMTRGIMMKILGKHGVEEYNPLDEKFDPNIHEALCQVNDPSREPNTIADVIQTGFKIKERVLRPAKVATVMSRPGETKNTAEEKPAEEKAEKKSI